MAGHAFHKRKGKKDAEKMELIESCCEDMHRSCDRCHSGADCAGDDLANSLSER